jgi:hypothetical protein
MELMELDMPDGAQHDSGAHEASGRSYACTIYSCTQQDRKHRKKYVQVFIRTPETKAATGRGTRKRHGGHVYLCTTSQDGLQQLQASLQRARSWADVQRCVRPFVTDSKLQRLAGMACAWV